MVFVLATAYALSFLDRQILNLLVGPVRASLQITDTQMSYLLGTAFGIFHAVFGLPLSRLVDRGSRRHIAFWSISLWSAMTAASGFARGYWQLFLARVGVGVGEAALNPSAFSMITDSFPPAKRPLAISMFHLGLPIGQGLSLIIGGAVIALAQTVDPSSVPFVHVEFAWQLVFLLVGLPGLVVALLMWTVREPGRRGLIETDGGKQQKVALGEVASFLSARRLTFFALYSGVALKIALAYASSAWVPTYFIRIHHWSVTEFGYVYGSLAIVTGVCGNLLCGGVGNWLAARGRKDAALIVLLAGYFIAIPFAIAAPLMPTSGLAMAFFLRFVVLHQFPRAGPRDIGRHHAEPDARSDHGDLCVSGQPDRPGPWTDHRRVLHGLGFPFGHGHRPFVVAGLGHSRSRRAPSCCSGDSSPIASVWSPPSSGKARSPIPPPTSTASATAGEAPARCREDAW